MCSMPRNPEKPLLIRGPLGPTGPFARRPLRNRGGPSKCISQLDIHEDKAMTTSTIFTSNRSQAVRLPKAVAFPAGVHQVDILKIGRSRLIVPQGKRWDDLFQKGPHASDDFMVVREQPQAEEREPL